MKKLKWLGKIIKDLSKLKKFGRKKQNTHMKTKVMMWTLMRFIMQMNFRKKKGTDVTIERIAMEEEEAEDPIEIKEDKAEERNIKKDAERTNLNI